MGGGGSRTNCCRRGWEVNPKRVHRLMREDNLLCVRLTPRLVHTRFDPQRRDNLQHFLSESAIHSAASKADAILPAIVVIALAEITRVDATPSPVTYMQLSTAMPAPR